MKKVYPFILDIEYDFKKFKRMFCLSLNRIKIIIEARKGQPAAHPQRPPARKIKPLFTETNNYITTLTY
jgi:hypothetical protein